MIDKADAERQIDDWLAAHEADMVSFCARLIQTPSVNGKNPEIEVAQLIADEARKFKLECEIFALEPDRPNVLISVGLGKVGLALVGHMDTVSIGDESAWHYSPFGAEIKDNRIYGRGAVDNKGGIAAALYTLAALKNFDPYLPGKTILVCVPDEESGATGRLGIKYLSSLGLLSGTGAIYVYPGLDKLLIGHRGVLRFNLEAIGEAVHTGSSAWQEKQAGCNAVTAMAEILNRLARLDFPYGDDYFRKHKTVITPTTISGGAGVSIVPPTCRASVDVRLIPNQSKGSILQAIYAVIESVKESYPKLSVNLEETVYLPSTVIPADHPIVKAVLRSGSAVLGIEPLISVAGPANEGYLLNEIDIPTICGFGPTGKNSHAPDEYVEIEGLVNAAKIYARVAEEMSLLTKN